jgi:hypothetical protein
MPSNMPKPTTFWDEVAARMSLEDMEEAMGEWEAHKLGDPLRQGVLATLSKKALDDRGIEMKNFGRVEASKCLLDAITRRAFDELRAARPLIEAGKAFAMSRLAYGEDVESFLEEPESATKAEIEEDRDLLQAVASYMRYVQGINPDVEDEVAPAGPRT